MHAMSRCGALLHTSHVAWSLGSVSWTHGRAGYKQLTDWARPIEMPLQLGSLQNLVSAGAASPSCWKEPSILFRVKSEARWTKVLDPKS